MEPFTFRKATEKDLQTATALIEQAKVFLWENGVDQWQTGYPNEGAIAGDLQRGEGYVMEAEGQVRGYACISFAGEPCGLAICLTALSTAWQLTMSAKEKAQPLLFSVLRKNCAKNGISPASGWIRTEITA